MKKVYLAGPIFGMNDAEAKGWREQAKAALAMAGLEASDPTDRDYRGREAESGIARRIVEDDLAAIDACDLVLAVLGPSPSYGTAMELFYAAHVAGKRTIVVSVVGARLSPWVAAHATCVVPTLEKGLELAIVGA